MPTYFFPLLILAGTTQAQQSTFTLTSSDVGGQATMREKTGLDATATPAVVGYTLGSQALAKASFVFYYAQ